MEIQTLQDREADESKIEQPKRSWASEHKAMIVSAVIGALGAIIAAVIVIVPSLSKPIVTPEFKDGYVVNYSFYNVLLDGFSVVDDSEINDEEKSIVTVSRVDSILKNTADSEDYKLPFYTTGKRMELETQKSSVTVVFEEVENPDENYRRSYELVLPIGKKPMGHNEIMHSRFTFINGFRDETEEWWIASVKYPTKAIGVHVQCPSIKPCKTVRVFRRKGISERQEILENPAFLSKDGLHILWMGNTENPDTRIMFQWTW